MKLESVQMLRALAALLVVFFHLVSIEGLAISENPAAVDPGAIFRSVFVNGYAGVDLFFVISGFIMVYVTSSGRAGSASVAEFLYARVTRIYPVWWLFAAMMSLWFLMIYGGPTQYASPQHQTDLSETWHLIASYLLLPQPGFPVLGVGWTLVHEIHFYTVFALLLFLPRRFLPIALLVWAGAVIAGALAGLTSPQASNMSELFFAPLSLEFILGAFAALAVTRLSLPDWVAWAALALGLGALVAGLAFNPPPSEFTLVWGRVLVFGPPCALIIFAVAALEARGRFKTPRSLAAIGDWSYALYLSHILVLSALKRILPASANHFEAWGLPQPIANLLRPGAAGVWDNLVFNLIGLTACLVVAWLTYRLFELPLIGLFGRGRRALFNKNAGRFRPASPVATAAP